MTELRGAHWRTLRTLITVGCFLIGTLLLWRTFAPRPPVVAQIATMAPADGVHVPMAVSGAATITPSSLPTAMATLAPTKTPFPTAPPLPTIAGVRPRGDECPADHLVKGNIVDRGETKGQRIYHLVGDNGYRATKPERCFVNAAEAELAGYRAVK